MSTLLVDNYDSYTYNVFHLLAAASGEEPIVVHNDFVSWRALARWDFDAIVLSPGPGRPERWHDFGVCRDILQHSEAPVLGICLGHQGLGQILDATVTAAPQPMHGRLSRVAHNDEGLFAGIPQNFHVVRYHSLAVTENVGPHGRVCAWTDEGIVMGIEHATRPLWGVQFHPESIATEHGLRLIENFYEMAAERRPAAHRPNRPLVPPRRCRRRRSRPGSAVSVCSIDGEPPAAEVFERLFAGETHAFWLDSATAHASPGPLAQGSYLGTTAGADRLVLEYDVERGVTTVDRFDVREEKRGSIFDLLERELQRLELDPPAAPGRGLLGGFVGYLGYELKADCGSPNAHRSDMPDAVMMLANRVVAIDHAEARTHVIAVHGSDPCDAREWIRDAERVVRALIATGEQQATEPDGRDSSSSAAPVFRSGRGRGQYLQDIQRSQAALAAGESYEVCLTDQFHLDAAPDPWRLYRLLRRRNPAPFAAYLKLRSTHVVSSSPERFLSVDRDRQVQARPIKGTAPRSADPGEDEAIRRELAADEKTFAEHLMIVDLLRNDLGRVCRVDTVRVPELMVIERHPTVHQMISNVVGELDPGCTPIDCVRACFPGGSMTGAPKQRTMEIIDEIEREARGVYSGSIGYFGLDGSVDLSIVIRTIVVRPSETTIGAGGAIVIQSDPEEEFEEVLLKARAPMSAVAEALGGAEAARAWGVDLGGATREIAGAA